MIKGIL
jgi:2-hydroxychromene-2-carboxylate isomerase